MVLALGVGPGGVDSAAAQERAETPPVSVAGTGGDNVHLSGGSASAHGWWDYPFKTELRADVTVQLQAKRDGAWTNVGAPGVKRVRPGDGRSVSRSNARVPCLNAVATEWRSVVDVDVVGKIDSPGKLITPKQVLNCGA